MLDRKYVVADHILRRVLSELRNLGHSRFHLMRKCGFESHRPHHAAALALVGWVLIFPPNLVYDCPEKAPEGMGCVQLWIDIGAPINEWQVVQRGFGTAHDCEEFRAQEEIILKYSNLTEADRRALERKLKLNRLIEAETDSGIPAEASSAERRAAGRCMPDDDPRLKPN